MAGDMERVSLFVPSLRGGGAERVMVTLAGEFARAGRAVDLVAADADGPYREEVSSAVRLVDLGRGRVMSAFPALCRYLRERRPHALLSTQTHANLIALGAKRLTRSPVRLFVREANTLSTASRDEASLRGRLMPLIVPTLYGEADGVVAPSEGVGDDLVENFRVPRERLRVIYNPVIESGLLEKAAATPEHPWLVEKRVPVILGVGRLTRQKDFPTLIRAFGKVRSRRPCRLIILGEGEERAALLRLIATLGLGEEVGLPGFVANPFACMRRASVFVLSSAWEGLPNVLIQALALGANVVATDCPSGPREILDGGAHGLLVPVGDVEAMATAIHSQLVHPVIDEGRAAACKRFELKGVAEEYLRLMTGAVH